MSALSGGIAPAFAKPDKNDPGIPVVPTTEVAVPDAPPQAQEQAPAAPPPAQKQAPKLQAPPQQAPPQQAPPQQVPVPAVEQAPAVQPAPTVEPAPAPQVQVPAPPKNDAPRVADAPRVVDAPKVDAPAVDGPKVAAPQGDPSKIPVPTVAAPQNDSPKVQAPQADPPRADAPAVGAEAPVQDQPPNGLTQEVQPTKGADQTKPESDGPRQVTERKQADPSAPKSAQRVTTAAPDTLQAPQQDIELARQAKPVEAKPDPAKKDDVEFLSSALNLSSKTKVGPFQSEFTVGSQFSVGDRDRDRDWDRQRDHDWNWDTKRWDNRVRQWDRRWIDYDDFYRPVFYNPFRAPVRIVYVYERAPRIVILPPLGRVVVDAAALAAYSFTAVVLNSANLAADVAVGTFFGGGYLPQAGAPFVPPPPLLRYDNVPVQVRYSNATYQPFRVNQIVDLGDDAQYGGRKVLLDGATPAWGQWTQSPTGERQFEVHRTQQYPGLGDPQEGPLPGDYRMQLASDQSANADRSQMYLMAAAGVVAGLGLGALGLAVYLGRRRPQG